MLALGAVPPQQLPAGLPVPEPDTLHNAIHVVWGAAIVGLMMRGLSALGASVLALCFAAFYVPLGVLGLLVDRPFGLMLGPGQNAFHFVVGPAALVLGAWGLARSNARATVQPSV